MKPRPWVYTDDVQLLILEACLHLRPAWLEIPALSIEAEEDDATIAYCTEVTTDEHNSIIEQGTSADRKEEQSFHPQSSNQEQVQQNVSYPTGSLEQILQDIRAYDPTYF